MRPVHTTSAEANDARSSTNYSGRAGSHGTRPMITTLWPHWYEVLKKNGRGTHLDALVRRSPAAKNENGAGRASSAKSIPCRFSAHAVPDRTGRAQRCVATQEHCAMQHATVSRGRGRHAVAAASARQCPTFKSGQPRLAALSVLAAVVCCGMVVFVLSLDSRSVMPGSIGRKLRDAVSPCSGVRSAVTGDQSSRAINEVSAGCPCGQASGPGR